ISGIHQKPPASSAMATASTPVATTRTASEPTISHFRFQWSAAKPAGKASSARGKTRAKPTMPAFAAEPVSAGTSSGNAVIVSWGPRSDRSRRGWSSRKPRFRRSGVAVPAPTLTAADAGVPAVARDAEHIGLHRLRLALDAQVGQPLDLYLGREPQKRLGPE